MKMGQVYFTLVRIVHKRFGDPGKVSDRDDGPSPVEMVKVPVKTQ